MCENLDIIRHFPRSRWSTQEGSIATSTMRRSTARANFKDVAAGGRNVWHRTEDDTGHERCMMYLLISLPLVFYTRHGACLRANVDASGAYATCRKLAMLLTSGLSAISPYASQPHPSFFQAISASFATIATVCCSIAFAFFVSGV